MENPLALRAPLFALLVACGGTAKPTTGPAGGDVVDTQPREIDIPAETIIGSSKYPPAPRQDIVDELHGAKVADPYRWLEDPADPIVKQWLAANDKQTRTALSELPYRDELAARFKELFYLDSVSAPTKRGRFYFYTRRHKDKEKSIVYWKKRKQGGENVLLDPNTMSADGHTSLGGWYPSWDGSKVAYAITVDNADESVLHIRNTVSGEDSTIDVLEGIKYSGASWTPKGDGFYYTYLPKDPSISVAERPGYAEVRFHKLGTEQAADAVVFPRTGSAQTFLGGDVSRDGRWLLIYVMHGWNATDVYYKDLRQKTTKRTKTAQLAVDDKLPTREKVKMEAERRGFQVLSYGRDAVYDVEVWKNRFYVMTNDGAPKYRIYKVNPKNADRDRWKEIVPEGDTPITSVDVIGGHLVIHFIRNAYTEIEIRKLNGKTFRQVALPGIGSGGLGGEPDDDEAYFSYSSFTQPSQIFKTSIKRGKPQLWAEIKIPADTSNVEVKQVWYESKDGTKIPMFIVHKQDTVLDGNNPTLLTGYGGFNVSKRPKFSTAAVTWLEHGGVFALANLRGGGEFGEEWHKAGMLLNKQNVFDDFIGAAEYLIRENYTNPNKLAIWGGSNGGLLVGAAMTQRPELFRAVVCAVPLLDMVRYHLFGSGKTWVPEYGSAEDLEQFNVLHGYSPYHRVVKGTEYPSLLMMAADADDRVDPMHARKFTAAVQWAAAGDRPHLIRVESNSGHGGADLVKQDVEKYADQFAFLFWQLGIK